MNKQFEGSKAFLNIPIGISRDKELLKKPKTILLMGEIVSMLNVTGEFFMSNKQIANRLDCTKSTVNDYLKILEEKGLIKRKTVRDERTGSIIGRKISAGDSLSQHIGIGWSDTSDYPSIPARTTLYPATGNKYNRVNRSSNRTVNNPSSRKKEEDPEREKIYKEFFFIARINDKRKNQTTRPSLDEIKQMRKLLYECDVDTLRAVKDKFKERMEWDMVGKPFAYLLKLLRDGLANDKNYESWG